MILSKYRIFVLFINRDWQKSITVTKGLGDD